MPVLWRLPIRVWGKVNVLKTDNRDDHISRLSADNAALLETVRGLRQRLAEVEELADTDALVPLPNRRAFERELARVIAGVARYGNSAAVLFFDLNGLKAVNDRHGHQAGDAMLLHVARQLKSSLRATDIVARIGGDEFAMILDHIDEAQARAKAQSLIAGIAVQPLEIGSASIPVGVSAGLAMILADDTVASVLARADSAMYAQRSER